METNKFKRAWIWLWYNDKTRLCVLLGLPTLLIIFILLVVFGDRDWVRFFAMVHYVGMIYWMLLDNDYSNLRRIGLNEYRKKLKGN